jgi:hypothetical protein
MKSMRSIEQSPGRQSCFFQSKALERAESSGGDHPLEVKLWEVKGGDWIRARLFVFLFGEAKREVSN